MDRADDGLVGRVDNLEGFSIYTFVPLIVDEAKSELASQATEHQLRKMSTYRPMGCSYSPVTGVFNLIEVIFSMTN